MMTSTKLMVDFLQYSRYSIASKDVDPLYPVLCSLHSAMELDTEGKLHHLMWYLGWYNLMSAQTAWEGVRKYHEPTIQQSQLPTGVERRGFRGGVSMLKHFRELNKMLVNYGGSFETWLTTGLTNNPRINWGIVFNRLTSVWGNGRWAAYKGCELLQKVAGLDLEPFSMGHEGSSGPRHGLELLFPENCPAHDDNSEEAIFKLDALSDDLLTEMVAAGTGVADLGEAETCLCDFHSMVNGGYYVGHDIDMLLGSVYASKAPDEVKKQILDAMEASLPHSYLGFKNEPRWYGVDSARKTAYRDQGQLVVRVVLP